jgi:hypothetical protein
MVYYSGLEVFKTNKDQRIKKAKELLNQKQNQGNAGWIRE